MVNGPNRHPMYTELCTIENGMMHINGDFSKFLLKRHSGICLGAYYPQVYPMTLSERIE